MAARERRRRVRASRPDDLSPVPFVGMGLLACDLFLFGASALFTPWWVVVLLVLAWVPLFGAATTWWTPHPRRIVVAGVVALVVWFAIVAGGAAVFGWS